MATAESPAKEKAPEHVTVLMAIDHSDQCLNAFEWYHEYLWRSEHRPLLVHVAELPAVTTNSMYMSADVYDGMLKEAKAKAVKLEEQFAQRMREKGMSGRVKAVFHARPGEAIVELATEEKAGLIVTGTRGLGTVRRTIMGSVSDYILHHAHCPVVICRHEEHDDHKTAL